MQRVAIARALVNNPDIILADEPTGNLDSGNSRNVFETLFELSEHNKMTLIYVTHNRELAGMADRIIEIKDGRIVDC